MPFGFLRAFFFTYLVSRFVYIHYYMAYDYSSFILILCSKDTLLNTHCKTSNCGHSHPEIYSLPNPALCHNRVNKISIVLFTKYISSSKRCTPHSICYVHSLCIREHTEHTCSMPQTHTQSCCWKLSLKFFQVHLPQLRMSCFCEGLWIFLSNFLIESTGRRLESIQSCYYEISDL